MVDCRSIIQLRKQLEECSLRFRSRQHVSQVILTAYESDVADIFVLVSVLRRYHVDYYYSFRFSRAFLEYIGK